jgi:PAS domain S-box-containing protein
VSNTAPNGAAAEAAIVIDRDGRIVEWTAGAERLFGYSRSEALGQPVGLVR